MKLTPFLLIKLFQLVSVAVSVSCYLCQMLVCCFGYYFDVRKKLNRAIKLLRKRLLGQTEDVGKAMPSSYLAQWKNYMVGDKTVKESFVFVQKGKGGFFALCTVVCFVVPLVNVALFVHSFNARYLSLGVLQFVVGLEIYVTSCALARWQKGRAQKTFEQFCQTLEICVDQGDKKDCFFHLSDQTVEQAVEKIKLLKKANEVSAEKISQILTCADMAGERTAGQQRKINDAIGELLQ